MFLLQQLSYIKRCSSLFREPKLIRVFGLFHLQILIEFYGPKLVLGKI